MTRTLTVGLALIALAACGRDSADAELKPVGVGFDPTEIGPSPTPYGGIVEYDHVEFGGGGLPLGLMGLSSRSEVGPELISFAPPYASVFSFAYIFDEKLEAADTYSQIVQNPPNAYDSCYTIFEPQGPLGSFTTVDVGDYLRFTDADGERVLDVDRFPRDYPPDAQDLFVYYFGVETWAPSSKLHWVPDPENPTDPSAMVEVPYVGNNFPFGQPLEFSFPGGISKFDQSVSSIPRPSSSVEGDRSITLPERVPHVQMSWSGPKHTYDYENETWMVTEGQDVSTCFQYYIQDDAEIAVPSDCPDFGSYPTSVPLYTQFKGQMYTGPWDATEGVSFEWDPGTHGNDIILSVRFMAEIDPESPGFLTAGVQVGQDGDGDPLYRAPQQCEYGTDDVSYYFDEDAYTELNGSDRRAQAHLQGDPQSRMAEVTCLLEDDGQFTLTEAHLDQAMTYAQGRGIGGVVFLFAHGTEAEAVVPAAKDIYDQRHDISPIRIASRSIRIGRFWWEGGAE